MGDPLFQRNRDDTPNSRDSKRVQTYLDARFEKRGYLKYWAKFVTDLIIDGSSLHGVSFGFR